MKSNIRQAFMGSHSRICAVIIMFVGINTFEVDPHMPMFAA